MSRIQDILRKAERDGNMRHSRSGDMRVPPPSEPPAAETAAPPRAERRIPRETRAIPVLATRTASRRS